MHRTFGVVAALSCLLPLAACGAGSSTPTATVTATQTVTASPGPVESSQVSTEAPSEGLGDASASPSSDAGDMHKFGETVQGEKVALTVSAPVPAPLPDDLSVCSFKPKAALKVIIAVKNTGQEPWGAAGNVIIDGLSGEKTACRLSGQDNGEYTDVLPSRTGKITMLFGVPSATDPLTVSIGAIGQTYWTNDAQALKAAGR